MHQNLDTCWLDVYETTEEHIQDYPDEEKDEWTKINKEQLDVKRQTCNVSSVMRSFFKLTLM